jgi:pimeloyl-ACP methyl ester carboxylesterase
MTDSISLNTVRLGSAGTPVLMLHGWGQSLESLRPLAELLAWKHQVHLIDLPGFGRSAKPPEPWGTIEYAKRVFDYIEQQGLTKVDLVGHSLGGRISIRLAAGHPERIGNIVLIASHGLQTRHCLRKRIRLLGVKTLRSIVKLIDRLSGTNIFAKKFSPRFGSRDYLNAGDLRPTLVKVVNEDLSDQASRINSRALLIWGDKDQETPLELGQRFNSLIKGSKLIVLPNKDHFPFNDSGAHLCAHFILPFLEAGGV